MSSSKFISHLLSRRPTSIINHHRLGALRFASSAAFGDDREERPRRSLFSCPGADPRKIAKAQTLGADTIVLDLEDGVALDKKNEARELVKNTLIDVEKKFGNSELAVRINGLDTKEMALRDLEAVLPCERLQAVVIPKVESAADIHFVSQMMDSLSPPDRDVRIIAAVESALGMMNIREIAETGGRLDALVFASEDFCADLEAIRTKDALELLYARSRLCTAAKAFGLQAIDMVHIQFRDLEGLAEECKRGQELGFTGKQAIHPIQVENIHKAFSPGEKDVKFALGVVSNYEATAAEGKGACVVGGVVIDFPVYKWAVKVIKRAETSGMV